MPPEQASVAPLQVRLAVDGPLLPGRAGLARIEIVNRGTAPILVSRRLNLMEGDLQLWVTDPSGARRKAPGWQVDSGPDRIELGPDRRLVGALNLLDAGDGPLLPKPGRYGLAVSYHPAPGADPVASEELAIAVGTPQDEKDRALAELLEDEALRRTLMFGEADAAPSSLSALADGFGGTLEGEMARLIRDEGSPDWRRAWEALHPEPLALAVLSLATPRSGTGLALAQSFAAWLGAVAAEAGAAQCLAIVRREPLAERPL